MSTLIKGGLVLSPSGAVDADVLVDGETIAAVGAPGTLTGDENIDATGKYVLPGGIDAHTHMEMPFGGTHSVDSFATGTTCLTNWTVPMEPSSRIPVCLPGFSRGQHVRTGLQLSMCSI